MTYVYLDPADYIVGKPISFEEYAQLVENANQAYGAGTNHGEVFATASSASAVGTSVSGSAPGPYSWIVPAGITKIRARGIGGGGGGASWLGTNGGDAAFQDWEMLDVVPGETITITPGAGGNGGAGVGGFPGNNGSNGTAASLVGSVSGALFSCDYGRRGITSGGSNGASGTIAGGKGAFTSPIRSASTLYGTGGAGTSGAFTPGVAGKSGFIEFTY